MASLAEIRERYPQYEDLSDEKLAEGLYRKYYSDMDRAEFDRKVGLAPGEGAQRGEAGPATARMARPGTKIAEAALGAVEGLAGAAEATGAGDTAREIGRASGARLRNVPEAWQQAGAGIEQGMADIRAEGQEQFVENFDGNYPWLLKWRPRIAQEFGAFAEAEGLIDSGLTDPQQRHQALFKAWANKTPEQQERFKAHVTGPARERAEQAAEDYRAAEEAKEPVEVEPGSPAYYVSGIVGSLAEMGPGFAASIATGNPAPAMAFIGALVGGQSYAEGREEGLDPEIARNRAILMSAAEAIPGAVPLSLILKPGSRFFRRLAEGGAAEGAQEAVTESLQILIDKGYLEPDVTWGEAKQRVLDASIMGAGAGGALATAAHGAQAAGRKAREFLPEPSPGKEVGREMGRQVREPSMADRIDAHLWDRGLDPEPVTAPPQELAPEQQPFDLDTYKAKVTGVESGGDPAARNPRSSAGGLGQFLDSTWVETVKKHAPEVARSKTRAEILAMKTDTSPEGVAFHEKMLDAFAQDTARQVERAGFELTYPNAYLFHFFGEGGGSKVLRADPETPIAELFPKDASGSEGPGRGEPNGVPDIIDANPHLADMTAGDAREWAAAKMGGSETMAPPGERVQPDMFGGPERTEEEMVAEEGYQERRAETEDADIFELYMDYVRNPFDPEARVAIERLEAEGVVGGRFAETPDFKETMPLPLPERRAEEFEGARSPEDAYEQVRVRFRDDAERVSDALAEFEAGRKAGDVQRMRGARERIMGLRDDIAANYGEEQAGAFLEAQGARPAALDAELRRAAKMGEGDELIRAADAPTLTEFNNAIETAAGGEFDIDMAGRAMQQASGRKRAKWADLSPEQRVRAVEIAKAGAPEQAATTPETPKKRGPRHSRPVSIARFLAERGGVQDEAGELSHLGADQWHRQKRPAGEAGFRPKLVRDGGMDLDTAAQAAFEVGFIPERDVRQLLDALDADMRGERVVQQDQIGEEQEFAAGQDREQRLDAARETVREALANEWGGIELVRPEVEFIAEQVADGIDVDAAIERWLVEEAGNVEQRDDEPREEIPGFEAEGAAPAVPESDREAGADRGEVGEGEARGQDDRREAGEAGGVEGLPDPNPTEAQKEAGNYRLGHLRWNGLDISIETAKGQERRGTDKDGEEWSVTMPADYGYIKRTEGADGDHVDVYLGEARESDFVLVVNQVDAETGRFDEHKAVLATADQNQALETYRGGFSDGRADKRIGSFTAMTVEEFKTWLAEGSQTKPTTRITRPFVGGTRPTEDAGPDGGTQTVVPGAERVTDRELAERRMSERKRAARDQRAPGEDGGLFDEGERNQDTLFLTQDMKASPFQDQPQPGHQPLYRSIPSPPRPEGDRFAIGERTVKLRPMDRPTRREGIRILLQDLIGPRIYQGKVKGKARLGFYRQANAEVRIKDFDDVEVMAHEMAHWLDFHQSHEGRFTKFRQGATVEDSRLGERIKDQVEQFSYTSVPKNVNHEGFAEFVRLWLTRHNVLEAMAPDALVEFDALLAGRPKLRRKMERLQEEMHRWFLQGDQARFRAKSGKELTPQQTTMEYLQKRPAERFRQSAIDRIHAAKVVERETTGTLNDAARSAYKQMQLVNGAEGLHEAIMRWGTPRIESDGTLSYRGKGLNDVFWPAAKHGYKRFDQLMEYFKARRAAELKAQGREHLFTGAEIQTGLRLADDYPEFVGVFEDFQQFNREMLDFYVQAGLITPDQRTAFQEANANYVPFHRVIERIEHPESGGTGGIGARLTGGQRNTRDIAENIVEGLFTNVRLAMQARAKATLYRDIMNSEEGALFAARIGPDSKKVRAHAEEMANRVAQIMAEEGVAIADNGAVVAGDPGAESIVDKADIEQRLTQQPELLEFWLHGQPPQTAETYVDSAIIDGKREWFEVRDPMLVEMLTGMKGMDNGIVLRAMFRAKNVMTRTVTSMAQFLGPNAVRDTLSATVISKNDFRPVVDTLIGMGDFIARSDTYREFMLQGGGYGTRIEARTQETRSRRRLDLPPRNLWDVSARVLAGWDRFTSAFEYGSRLGDYRRGTQAGRSKLEAAWQAREIATDFAKLPRNELWARYLRVVPFMNAGLQGLDKVAREVSEMKGKMTPGNLARLEWAKAQFLLKGSLLTSATFLLWMLNEDDERYQALTEDQRMRFWWIFLPEEAGGHIVKIPKPYDVGALFGNIPEIALNYIKDRDGRDAARNLAFAGAQTFAIGDYPGIFQPWLEVGFNEKFTGAPVVPHYMLNVPPEYQYHDRTPIMYRKLGEHLGVSPLVAEHYTRGYLRYVEAYIADASEHALWNEEKWGERPFAEGPADYVLHQFKGQPVPYRTKWTEGYYELKERAAGLATAVSQLEEQAVRDEKPLEGALKSSLNQTLLLLNGEFGKIDRAFADMPQAVAAIRYDKKLSAEEKEQRIETLYAEKNRVLGDFYRAAQEAIDEAERKLAQ